jgi:multidrug efflux pump subunit AcrB
VTGFFRFMIQRRAFVAVLMAVFLLGGLFRATSIRQELMPDRNERYVEISVELQGASPNEIGRSILSAIENAVRGVDGIKRIDAEAFEGIGIVSLPLLRRADPQQVLGDIKNAVDRISTFPRVAEKPVVTIPSLSEKALSLIVSGDQPPLWLQRTAEAVRDDLRKRVGLTKVQLAFPREREIAVSLKTQTLRQYGLSIEDIAGKIRQGSLERPAGTLYGRRSDYALRIAERRERAEEFGDIVIAYGETGIPVRLADIAVLEETLGEVSIESWFNGKPAVQIDVYAVGSETPMSVEAAVRNYLDTVAGKAYPGVAVEIFENQASAYRQRTALLIDNALLGLVLVLVTLGLFLTPHLAFWVMAGIPTALLGGLLLLPMFGASINMLSLFAFIVTIGVVVDDAIMMGEAIHRHRVNGSGCLEAALQGVKELGGPVTMATATTTIAFLPLFFVPGEMGVLFAQIPAVVIAVLLVSLVEALFILPAHLAKEYSQRRWLTLLARPQRAVNARLKTFVQGPFRNFMHYNLDCPGVSIAMALSLLLITIGAIVGGLIGFSFTPTIEADCVMAQATLPYGTPKSRSLIVRRELVAAANDVLKANGMASPGVFALIGTRLEGGEVEVETMTGSHYISALVALPPESERTLSGPAFAHAWRQAFGEPEALESLNITGQTNVTGGEPIRLGVFHPDTATARQAALWLGERMRAVSCLTAIDDGIRAGKPELEITLKESGLRMGLSAEAVARQVRHRYHGAEALRFVRDGNEIKVMVRLDEKDRSRYGSLPSVLLKTPAGALVPLAAVADIEQTLAFTSLVRRDGKRIFPVTADIPFGISDDAVEAVLAETILPRFMEAFPGVSVIVGGEEEEADEALAGLGDGFLLALGAMYLLLVLHYNSYTQPILILSVIPFSCVGAIWGHILLGCDLSIISAIGIVAMAGVVVNDALVLITTYNRQCAAGTIHRNAVVDAACHRFRPILLTSATTFFGLMPLMLERSEQAQFLIPAAISIAFGLVFGTVITLVFVPGLLGLFSRRRECR